MPPDVIYEPVDHDPFASEAVDYDPFAAEKFVPQPVAAALPQVAQSDAQKLKDFFSAKSLQRPESYNHQGITAEDIDRGMNVAMAGMTGPIKRLSTNLPNIRRLPVDQAIEVARSEPHLIPAGDRSEGAYVGGPRDIQSRADLDRVRSDFDAYVAADPRGGNWYDRYRDAVNEVTGGDPLLNRWMTNQEGQWSAGVSPEGELGFALKENNASLAGMPVKSARPAQHEAHERAIAARDPDLYQLGDKTGAYARLIEPNPDRIPGATGVNDFRHARNFTYTEANGEPQKAQLTDAGHRFLDYETALAVDRANKANLGGRSNWTGEQLQAAPWVRQKALDLQSRNPNLSYDEAFARANTTIGDYFDKHTAFATHEAQPGAGIGHLPGLEHAPQAEKDAYAADLRSRYDFAPGGRDAIYSGLGIEGTGNYMRVRPTLDMQGVFTPPPDATRQPLNSLIPSEKNLAWIEKYAKLDREAGRPTNVDDIRAAIRRGEDITPIVTDEERNIIDGHNRWLAHQQEGIPDIRVARQLPTEYNRGQVARPLVAFDSGNVKSLPQADRSILNAGESLRAFLDAQHAGAYHKPFLGGAPGESNSLFTPLSARATPEQLQALRARGAPAGLPDVVDTGQGVTMTNFGGTTDSKGLGKALKGGLDADIKAVTGSSPRRAKVDSGYLPLDFSTPGSGAATTEMLKNVTATPELRAAMNNNVNIPKAALDRLERDTEASQRYGAAREDIQNARRIIGEGKGWVDRIESALKRGAILPAVAVALLAPAYRKVQAEGRDRQ